MEKINEEKPEEKTQFVLGIEIIKNPEGEKIRVISKNYGIPIDTIVVKTEMFLRKLKDDYFNEFKIE